MAITQGLSPGQCLNKTDFFRAGSGFRGLFLFQSSLGSLPCRDLLRGSIGFSQAFHGHWVPGLFPFFDGAFPRGSSQRKASGPNVGCLGGRGLRLREDGPHHQRQGFLASSLWWGKGIGSRRLRLQHSLFLVFPPWGKNFPSLRSGRVSQPTPLPSVGVCPQAPKQNGRFPFVIPSPLFVCFRHPGFSGTSLPFSLWVPRSQESS